MMTLNASAGIRDAIVQGTVELGLPLSNSLLSLIHCEVDAPCRQGRCPICASKEAQRLRYMLQSPRLSEQDWQHSVYALRSHVREAGDVQPIKIETITAAINKTLNEYVRAFSRQEDARNKSYGCLAHFGLVEDTSAGKIGEKVAVVEFVLTGGDSETDYEVMNESLHYNFGVDVCDLSHGPLQVEPVPIISTNGYGVLPDEGLLFGYTRRRLDAAERPMVIADKIKLAEMACNYGEHRISDRTFYRGLAKRDNCIVFDPSDLATL